MKIAFIGGGAMGEVILSAVLAGGLSTPAAITVSDVKPARCEHLENCYAVAIAGGNRQAVGEAALVVLAVKPQDLVSVMAELKGVLVPGQLVMSIVAGARLNSLFLGLEHGAIVRVMPNTPAQVGQGMSIWTATDEVSEGQREETARILGAMGRELYVDDERYLDMATAVSGSGPAYFFYMIEALVAAAADIGLPPEVATELVLQTMLGAGHLLRESGRKPEELRRTVTSPGGTTAAAIRRFEDGGFAEIVKRAVRAAYERAKELGG